MSKPVNREQSQQFISVLVNNVDWDALDAEVIQLFIENPNKTGELFTGLLRGEVEVVLPKRTQLQIRTGPEGTGTYLDFLRLFGKQL